MTIPEIKEALARPASLYLKDWLYPFVTTQDGWIGSIRMEPDGFTPPKDPDGQEMVSLLSMKTEKGYRPSVLADCKLINVYVSPNWREHIGDENMSSWFAVFVYTLSDLLVPCERNNPELHSVPLRSMTIYDDFPAWGGGIPNNIEDELLRLEKEEHLDYFRDICTKLHANTKLGGWPTYVQNDPELPQNYQFVFQITSDCEAGLNIVDNGSFYFFYDTANNNWKIHCDFY